MKKRPLIVIPLAVLLMSDLCVMVQTASDSALQESAERWKEFAGTLDETIPGLLRKHDEPGLAVALIESGVVVWSKGYGVADRDAGHPVTTDTVFQVGSISKSLTAWGILKLAEQNKIGLDDPVSQHLTRWRIPESKFDASRITIRRLLTHTAGTNTNGYAGFRTDAPDELARKLPPIEDVLAHGEAGIGVSLISEPGTAWAYSGGGYSILQLVIEEVTGERFADFMKTQILEPLEMNQSGFGWSDQVAANVATPYNDTDRQRHPHYLFTSLAAAGLYTTVDDLARFVAANTAGANTAGEDAVVGREVVSAELLKECWEGNEVNDKWGAGYELGMAPGNTRVVFHGGSNIGWKAHYFAVPDQGAGIVVMTNTDTGAARMEVLNLWRKWVFR